MMADARTKRGPKTGLGRKQPLGVLLLAALLLTPLPAAAAEACRGPLTGPDVAIAPDLVGFGVVQGFPKLALEPNQYAVTIDDGPNPATTPKLLAVLAKHCVKATFFLVGKNAKAHPDLVRAILAEGHTIGTHSYSHSDFSKLSRNGIEAEMLDGLHAVEAASAGAPAGPPSLRLFRFPGSSGFPAVVPPDLVDMARRDGLTVAGIDFSPQDWRNSPPAESFKRLFGNLGDRGVILFHDGMSNTIDLLPMALDELQRRGKEVVLLKP